MTQKPEYTRGEMQEACRINYVAGLAEAASICERLKDLRCRKRRMRAALETVRPRDDECRMTVGEMQDELNAEAYRNLTNPGAFFPYLDGGVYGSPALQQKYGRR